jgi:hypothetical protein
MQAFGSDRVRQGEGEQIVLSSRLSKGWTSRVGKTLTSAEFPGTAILWEERYFEVVSAEELKQGGVRYVLEPWRDHHTMRVTDRYDAESEAFRADEYRRSLRQESARKTANIAGVFTGSLPAIVQEHLARELGIMAARLTFISILGTWLIVGGIVLGCVSYVMRREPMPLFLIAPAVYLSIENAIRFLIYWTQSRPIGSTIGWIFYAIFHFITGRGPSPFGVEKGYAVKISAPPDDVAQRDAFAVRSAFVTLLTPEDQARVAARFEYDYRRESPAVAITILLVAAVGIVSSYMRGAAIALIVAAALAIEQIVRLAAFRRGPAASVLRFVVRPFVRKLL